jgi:hypothetical protein
MSTGCSGTRCDTASGPLATNARPDAAATGASAAAPLTVTS